MVIHGPVHVFGFALFPKDMFNALGSGTSTLDKPLVLEGKSTRLIFF
jgi:hypothetical protein